MRSFLVNLKRFMLRGNIINYVVAIGIGSAFVLLVNSFVKGIVMPLVSFYILGDPEVLRKKVILCPAKDASATASAKNEVSMQYGLVLESLLNLVFIAISLYGILNLLMRIDSSKDLVLGETAPDPSTSFAAKQSQRHSDLLVEIRDLLKRA